MGLLGLAVLLVIPPVIVYLDGGDSESSGEPRVSAKSPEPSSNPSPSPEADPMDSEPEPKPKPAPEPRRKELMAKLRERFDEDTLIKIAKESVAAEDAIRAELGDSDEAYERMEKAWAELCRTHGLSAVEREALENEAIVKGWIGSPPD